jgi:hypothetical protein
LVASLAFTVNGIRAAAGLTVSVAFRWLLRRSEVPAKIAVTPLLYVFAAIPTRLTFAKVATPFEFVVALPTGVSFKAKLIVWFGTGLPVEVSVACRVVVPPNVPAAGLNAMFVGRSALAGMLKRSKTKSNKAPRAVFVIMMRASEIPFS